MCDELTATKGEIRRMMRARRRAVSAADRAAASQAVCARLLARDEVCAALAEGTPIAVYLASADELDLTPFVTAALARGALLVAPRWNGRVYELGRVASLEAMVAGPHGILEPPTSAEGLPPPSVWLVPGLAFTASGKRLGYGGGWYDRLLAGLGPESVRLGVGFGFQLVADLPSEPHDVRLQGVVVPCGGGTVGERRF